MRIEKVNELVKREISHMFQMGEISDPRVSFVTILSVEVSKDLQHAKVKFSTLSDDAKDVAAAQEGLESCSGYIRKVIGSRIVLRYTPQIKFIYDKGLKYAADIDRLLMEVKQKKQDETGVADEGL